MALRKIAVVLICFFAGTLVLIPAGIFIWNESFYFDRVPIISPIECEGMVPIRHDTMGNGHFAASRNGNRLHNGVDILAPVGTPVRAAKGGLAVAGEHKEGMGKYVKIKHKNGFSTMYGHLSKIHIKVLQKVRQGEVIGEVGKTGNANYRKMKAHLHFEIRKDGIAQDPMGYLGNEIPAGTE